MAILKPIFVPLVPKLLTKFYDEFKAKLASLEEEK